jgi:uncharacterized membrane protein
LLLLFALLFYAISSHKVFKYIPAVVLLYATVMVFASSGLLETSEVVTQWYKMIKTLLLPSMIIVMMMQVDIKLFKQLNLSFFLIFFTTTATIMFSFIAAFYLLGEILPQEGAKTLGALSGSWMGGTANMIAVASSIGISDHAYGYTLLMDSVNYALWIMFLLLIIPYAPIFNRWTNAQPLLQVSPTLTIEEEKSFDIIKLLGTLLIVLVLAWGIGKVVLFLPTSSMFSATTWSVVIATVIGLGLSQTPLRLVKGVSSAGSMMLFFLIALIASRADIAQMGDAPIFIITGFVILFVHALLLTIMAKLFRLDLLTLALASVAHIGGVASAPIIAASYHKALIPIGILMAILGYIIGTFGGLFVAYILGLMA